MSDENKEKTKRLSQWNVMTEARGEYQKKKIQTKTLSIKKALQDLDIE